MKEFIMWCPLCNKTILYVLKEDSSHAKCKFCGHHLVIRYELEE